MFSLRTTGVTEKVTLRNLPTIRQTFVIASAIIIAAFVLARIVHPDFIYLALLPAFGLMISGLFGFCPLIFFLQLLPCNKAEEVPETE